MIYREPSLWFFKFECHHRIIGLERAYWCSDVQYMRLPAHLVFQKKKIVCVSAEIQLATQLSNALHRTVQYLLLVRQFAQLLSLPLLYSPLCPHLRHHPRKCCFFFFPAIFNSFGHPSYLHLESKLERLFHLRVFFFFLAVMLLLDISEYYHALLYNFIRLVFSNKTNKQKKKALGTPQAPLYLHVWVGNQSLRPGLDRVWRSWFFGEHGLALDSVSLHRGDRRRRHYYWRRWKRYHIWAWWERHA